MVRKASSGAKKSSGAASKNSGSAAVDAYLAGLPQDQRDALSKLRRQIKAAAPDATEGISYRMPMFKHYGVLVGFAAFKGHCGFFVTSPAVVRAHASELRGYEQGKGSVRFTPGKPLPAALVTKLVRARVAENETLRKKT